MRLRGKPPTVKQNQSRDHGPDNPAHAQPCWGCAGEPGKDQSAADPDHPANHHLRHRMDLTQPTEHSNDHRCRYRRQEDSAASPAPAENDCEPPADHRGCGSMPARRTQHIGPAGDSDQLRYQHGGQRAADREAPAKRPPTPPLAPQYEADDCSNWQDHCLVRQIGQEIHQRYAATGDALWSEFTLRLSQRPLGAIQGREIHDCLLCFEIRRQCGASL